MKRMFKKFVVTLIVSLLIITPASSALADDSDAVLIADYGRFKFFEFETPHQLLPGQLLIFLHLMGQAIRLQFI